MSQKQLTNATFNVTWVFKPCWCERILTREILHQSIWNWALNFLSQLMTGSISWLQRSWLWGLSTSRRHDEKGTSAPTITYTLGRGGEERRRSIHLHVGAFPLHRVFLLDAFILQIVGMNVWCITYGSSCGLFPSELNQLTVSISADSRVCSSNSKRSERPQGAN